LSSVENTARGAAYGPRHDAATDAVMLPYGCPKTYSVPLPDGSKAGAGLVELNKLRPLGGPPATGAHGPSTLAALHASTVSKPWRSGGGAEDDSSAASSSPPSPPLHFGGGGSGDIPMANIKKVPSGARTGCTLWW
jgi:hypothetical protein